MCAGQQDLSEQQPEANLGARSNPLWATEFSHFFECKNPHFFSSQVEANLRPG